MRSSEHGNGPSGFVKGKKSGEELSDGRILLHVVTEKGSCGCGICRKPNRATFSTRAPHFLSVGKAENAGFFVQ